MASDTLGHNKLHYIFELGEVIPNVQWRRIFRNRKDCFSSYLLKKRTSFLPAFSFSLDRTLAFVYWGEHQTVLDPQKLGKLKLKQVLVTIEKPSSMQISAANLAWPRYIENIVFNENDQTIELGKNYVFNSLLPPDINNETPKIWMESPFVILTDNTVEALSIHKTIASIERDSIKWIGRDLCQANCYILNKELGVSKVICELSEDAADLLSKVKCNEAIITKSLKLSVNDKKSVSRISLYPFQFTQLFSKGAPGILLTVLSILLRQKYIQSNSLSYKYSLFELRSDFSKILNQHPFKTLEWDNLGTRFYFSDEGLKLLINNLKVYQTNGEKIQYLHPSLWESLSLLIKDYNNLGEDRCRQMISELAITIEKELHRLKLTDKFELRDRLAIHCAPNEIDHLLASLYSAKEGIIPLSKMLDIS